MYSVKGNVWGGSSIREICIRALEGVYSGLYYWNRTGRDLRGTGTKWKDTTEWTVIENAHPPIISLEEWEQLKSVRGPEIEARKGKGTANPKTVNSRWLLSGKNALGEDFFICLNGTEEAPHHLVSAQMGKDEWYLCGTYRNKGLAGCDKPFYVDKSFENTVFRAILNRFSPDNISQLVKEVNQLLQADIKDIQSSKKHIQKLISENDKKARELVSALSEAGAGAKKFILAQLEELSKEKDTLENQSIDLEKEKPELNLLDEATILNYIKRAPLLWENGTNAEKREFLRRFIYNLELDPNKGIVYINFFADPLRSKPITIKTVNDPKNGSLTGISNGAGDRT